MYVIIEARKTSVIMMLSSSGCPLSGPLLALLSFFFIFEVPAKLAQLKFSAAHLAIDLKFSLPWQKGQNLIKHLLGQH